MLNRKMCVILFALVYKDNCLKSTYEQKVTIKCLRQSKQYFIASTLKVKSTVLKTLEVWRVTAHGPILASCPLRNKVFYRTQPQSFFYMFSTVVPMLQSLGWMNLFHRMRFSQSLEYYLAHYRNSFMISELKL